MCVRNSCGCLPVGGWPCVQALLSVDNIVSGGWLTEGTWRHEIIPCRAMCSPIGTRRVLTSSQIHLQPFRQLFLPGAIRTPTVFPVMLRFSGTSVTLHALLSKNLNYFHPPFVEVHMSNKNTWLISRTGVLSTMDNEVYHIKPPNKLLNRHSFINDTLHDYFCV